MTARGSLARSRPRELRGARAAFNAMQAQIQALVEARTAVFAAISHDLRHHLQKSPAREFTSDRPVATAGCNAT